MNHFLILNCRGEACLALTKTPPYENRNNKGQGRRRTCRRMKFDPEKHHRRSIRLKDYDYSQGGAYFVTILAKKRECVFGEIVNGEMHLSKIGQVAEECWEEIPRHFPDIDLDAYVIMPNHIHGILVIGDVGARHASPLQNPPPPPDTGTAARPTGVKRGSIGAIVGSFKSVATKRINELRRTPGEPVWQRNYFEHVIRSEESLNKIREYIFANPAQWETDPENPKVRQIREGSSA